MSHFGFYYVRIIKALGNPRPKLSTFPHALVFVAQFPSKLYKISKNRFRIQNKAN